MPVSQAIVTSSFQYFDGDFGVTARAQWGRADGQWREDLDIEGNHREAAVEFACDRGWLKRNDPTDHARLVGGAMPDGKSFCWVLLPPTEKR